MKRKPELCPRCDDTAVALGGGKHVCTGCYLVSEQPDDDGPLFEAVRPSPKPPPTLLVAA